MPAIATKPHKVVSREQWIAARKALLVKEKKFTREREALAKARRALPWEKVEKEYVFVRGPAARRRWPSSSTGKVS
jgi:predicted dithiol-disulfide oxidoreductase (DUF899 family)